MYIDEDYGKEAPKAKKPRKTKEAKKPKAQKAQDKANISAVTPLPREDPPVEPIPSLSPRPSASIVQEPPSVSRKKAAAKKRIDSDSGNYLLRPI